MSGHSKWSKIKRQKGASDTKRSNLFTKLAKNIAVAARNGTDPDMNFKLRMAIDKARSFSMPKDSIARAITRGSGKSEGEKLETAIYEGYGQGGVAIIAEVVTDNKNRTVSEIKHIFSKYNGNLASAGSVAWIFDLRGIITLKEAKLTEEQELALIDVGMLDLEHDDDGSTIITELDKLQPVEEAAKKKGLTVSETSIGYVAKEKIDPANEEKIITLLSALDDLDDVTNVYTNANV